MSKLKYNPCGGCGADNPMDRCIGCGHPFGDGVRHPSDMTDEELNQANDLLSDHFVFVPEIGIEVTDEDLHVLKMEDLKAFFDYLTSINVDPYAK